MKDSISKAASLVTSLALILSISGPLTITATATGYSISQSGSPVVSGTTVTISGTASANPYKGAADKAQEQHGLSIDWGDSVGNDVTKMDCPANPNGTLNFTNINTSAKTFSATWTESYTYSSSGTYHIFVRVHHSQCPGAESSTDGGTIEIIVVVPPPTPVENSLSLCTDSLDNDSDTLVDLNDPDCASFVPKLTVTKFVVGGGSKVVADFPLFVDLISVVSGIQNTFLPGNHVVSETNSANYTATFAGSCDTSGNVNLAAGETKSCSITNTYVPPVVLGCTNPVAENYNPLATQDNGSCTFSPDPVPGCTDSTAINYNPNSTVDNGSCTYPVLGCTNPAATNYNPAATVGNADANKCTFSATPVIGCMDNTANNYNSEATEDTTPTSCTYNQTATPTCSDGIMNQDETGVDSGGVCTPAPEPAPVVTNQGTGGGGGSSGSRHRDVATGSGGGEVLGATTDEDNVCGEPYLKEYIKPGAQNNPEEVKKLQIFLNLFFEVHNPVTGYYGPITQAMVNKFQAHENAAVLVPWTIAGYPTNGPTGYVYKTTKRWINILRCPEMVLNTPVPYPLVPDTGNN